jgi:NosR/NirI family nitrous oxide reductase transcriptional regulator
VTARQGRGGRPTLSRRTVPPPGRDLAAVPIVARLLRWPPARFVLALPAIALLGLVLVAAFLGPADPQRNLATTLTWNVWFCVVFVVILGAGRGWCLVCPFGAVSEAVQRRALWGRGRPIGAGHVLSHRLTQYGYLLPIATLVLLTWLEERFAIAEGGAPALTGYLLVGILAFSVAAFLVFERRTFCRYLCPLSGLIGVLGAVAPVAGFRSRDVDACRACTTRECLRGSATTSGCPWYAWPGSEESNLSCGLCAECVTACPTDQVGLYVTAPLDSVIGPRHRRADVAWGVAVLLGLAIQEQVHRTAGYRAAEIWCSRILPLPEFGSVVVFLGSIAAAVVVTATVAWSAWAAMRRSRQPAMRTVTADGSFVHRGGGFRTVFLPLTYACLPLVASDYFATQLPGFFQGAAATLPALLHPFTGGTRAGISASLAPVTAIVTMETVVVFVGLLASLYAVWRITGREPARRPRTADRRGPGDEGRPTSGDHGKRQGQIGNLVGDRGDSMLARVGMSVFVVVVGLLLMLLVLAPVLVTQPASSASSGPWLT